MMRLFRDLRQTLYDMRKRVLRRTHRRLPVPIHPGLPESLQRETIATLCEAHFGAPPRSFRQQHLSGWKASGAYRIFVEMEGGQEIRLIYKIAVYNPEDIPALSGLPVQPGPAEFAILSNAGGPLAPYLPCLYMAEEAEPSRLYRYIMEDLSAGYHRVITKAHVWQAAELFPAFHDALRSWVPGDDSGLIHYGRDFSAALQAYAQPRLEQYLAQHDDPAVREILNNWTDVCRTHMDGEFFDTNHHGLIHGDPNYSNVYLHNENPQKMKLVDWEWAGFGSPYADLVSLLKGDPSHLERLSVELMAAHLQQPAAQAHRLYTWCHLERGILDAAFLSVQALTTEHQTRFSLHSAVSSSASRAIRAYRQLT